MAKRRSRPIATAKPAQPLALVQQGEAISRAIVAFPAGVGALTWGQRFDILDAWAAVLDGLYAHLPLKRAMYGFDPIRALEHLRSQVPELSDLQFHRQLTSLINRLRDAHTQYTGPKTLASTVATLPFLVEAYGPADNPSYVVTKVTASRVDDPEFVPGVVLEWWNGVPFDRAVDLHADVETGGRPDARRARALESMTFRALGYAPPPDEEWVILGYRTEANQSREVRFEWRIVNPERSPNAGVSQATRVRRAINPAAEAIRRAKKLMFNAELWQQERALSPGLQRKASGVTGFEDFLSSRTIDTAHGSMGYLRIWSFDVDNDQDFIDAAIRLLAKLPDRGLIIDLRDNPGGFIWAAERMLQLFTASRISPTKFALRATPLTAAIAGAAFNASELGPWAASLAGAAATGEPYSSHLPITTIEQCNDVGQVYGGPVVIIVDANTYSSGDLFTAGIVDNRIGPVVCIGNATGAGGANVWSSDDVQSAMMAAKVRLPDLPAGTTFTLAVRRAVRSGEADGVLIEDNGIAGQSYAMTRADVLNSNHDLIAHCAELIASQPWTRMKVDVRDQHLTVETIGLDRLDLFADGHPAGPSTVVKRDGVRTLRVSRDVTTGEVIGYAGASVKQRRRFVVQRQSRAVARSRRR
jgi:C-terminal processing protease CtpA/Prc